MDKIKETHVLVNMQKAEKDGAMGLVEGGESIYDPRSVRDSQC